MRNQASPIRNISNSDVRFEILIAGVILRVAVFQAERRISRLWELTPSTSEILASPQFLPQHILHIANFFSQHIQLARQPLNLHFGSPVDVIVQFAA